MKLSRQAKEILEEIQAEGSATVEQLEKKGYDQSMVNRAALELGEEEIAEIQEEEELDRFLTEKGQEVIEKGSPEHRLIQKLEDGSKEISRIQGIDRDVAVGKAREKGWIEIYQGEVELTDEGRNELGSDPVRSRLEDRDFKERDQERGLVGAETVTHRMIQLTDQGKNIDIDEVVEEFNVEARTKTPRTGKKHYYRNIQEYARRVWLDMGFEEMRGNYVVPSFLNFDALYTAQDHPARELHDTFFVENPGESDLSEFGEKVEHVKEVHENGWETGSSGWNYDWDEEEAEKNVLRTHTTAISARKLHEIDVNEEELPKKLFIVGRNFRKETVDRTHLAEFFQTDGFVIGKDVDFKNLKGYLSEFFERMGYEKFRLIPSYYPYTEMSVEVQVWDEEEETWLGMGGAGMFRPEVVKPLLGFEAKVLAWGLGLPRIAFIAAGLSDIRELYRNDIRIINQTPVWRPETGGDD